VSDPVTPGPLSEASADHLDRGRAATLLRFGSTSLGTAAVVLLLTAATGVLIARALGPLGRGQLAAIIVWPTLLTVLGELGIVESTSYFASSMPGHERRIFAAALVMALAVAAILVPIDLLLTQPILWRYGVAAIDAGRIYALWFPPYFIMLAALGMLQGKLAITAANGIRLSLYFVTAIGVGILFVFRDLTLLNIVYTYLVAIATTALLSVAVAVSRGWLGTMPDITTMRAMFVYGVKSHTGSLSSWANERVDIAILSLLVPAASLGYYAIANSLTTPVLALGNAIASFAQPMLVQIKQRAEMDRLLGTLVRMTLVFATMVTVVLVVAAPQLVGVLYGKAFGAAVVPTRLLAVAMAILAVNRVVAAGLRAFNHPLAPGIAEFAGLVTDLVLIVVLVPALSITGAAAASIAGSSVGLVIVIWLYSRRLSFTSLGLLMPARSDLTAIGNLFRRGGSAPASPSGGKRV
jgi:O-antigen/teichoic acid export membrane protein